MTPVQIATLLLGLAAQAIAAAIKLKQTSSQTVEWTDAEEAAFDKQIADARAGLTSAWVVEKDPD